MYTDRGKQSAVSLNWSYTFTERLYCTVCCFVGEPIMYPRINELIKILHGQEISSFLVTNAQFPDAIRLVFLHFLLKFCLHYQWEANNSEEMWSWRSAGTSNNHFFYTTIAQSHTTGFQYRMYLSMLNASERIATPPDMKTQKPLHGKKGNIYPQLLKCSQLWRLNYNDGSFRELYNIR